MDTKLNAATAISQLLSPLNEDQLEIFASILIRTELK